MNHRSRLALILTALAMAAFMLFAPGQVAANFEDEDETGQCCPDWECKAYDMCFGEGFCLEGNKCTIQQGPPLKCPWKSCQLN